VNHQDPQQVYLLVEAVNEGRFLDFACPVPEDLKIEAGPAEQQANLEQWGYRDSLDFCTEQWGTKWDVETVSTSHWDVETPFTVEYDDQHDTKGVVFGFDSAWTPPLGAMEYLVHRGFSVKLYYYEPGMGFCGLWEDGIDSRYEILEDSQWVVDHIPRGIDDAFGISDSMAEWEQQAEEPGEEDS
jgi:hypothetical protein